MIDVEGLCKVYGNRVAVWRVTFSVARGEIVGFLGPNGAGKTTTMRMITGFIPPSSGTAAVDGHDVAQAPLEVKRRIGYLCEAPPVYREMSVSAYLRFVAEIKQVPRTRRPAAIDRAVELCGLTGVSRRVIGHLSKGYRQRVGLAQAIIHEPAVLILDEPTVGLDPTQIIEIRRLIKELSGEQTVVLSTHILPEVTMTCDRVVIIHEGQVVAQDRIENLTDGIENLEAIRISVARDPGDLDVALSAVDGVHDARRQDNGVYLARVAGGPEGRERLASAVVGSGCGLLEFQRQAATLEDVFLRLVTDESHGESS